MTPAWPGRPTAMPCPSASATPPRRRGATVRPPTLACCHVSHCARWLSLNGWLLCVHHSSILWVLIVGLTVCCMLPCSMHPSRYAHTWHPIVSSIALLTFSATQLLRTQILACRAPKTGTRRPTRRSILKKPCSLKGASRLPAASQSSCATPALRWHPQILPCILSSAEGRTTPHSRNPLADDLDYGFCL